MDSDVLYVQLEVLACQLDIIKPDQRIELLGILGDLLSHGNVAVRNVQRTVEICGRLGRKQLGAAGLGGWAEKLRVHCLQMMKPNSSHLQVLDGLLDVRWFSWVFTYAQTLTLLPEALPDTWILDTFYHFLRLVARRRLQSECTTRLTNAVC